MVFRRPGFILFQIQNPLCGLMGDLLELFIRQIKLLEPLNLLHRVPQGVIGAVGHPFCAVGIDVIFRLALFHEHQGAGNIKDAVGVPQQFPGGVVHAVAAEMGSDHIQLGEQIQDLPQPDRMGIVVAQVAHVKDQRDPSLNGIVHRVQPHIVDGKPLGIGMHFDTPEARIQDPVRFGADTGHLRMDGAEADKIIILLRLLQNEAVDAVDPVGGIGNGQDHVLADTGLSAPLPEHFHGTIHIAAVQLVKFLDAVGCLPGHLIGVNMGMDVDDLHITTLFQKYGTIIELSNPKCKLFYRER